MKKIISRFFSNENVTETADENINSDSDSSSLLTIEKKLH